MTSTVDSSGIGFENRASLRLMVTQLSCGQPVLCPAERLRLHPIVEELGCLVLDEANDAAQLNKQTVCEPILITTNGTILAGFGRWRIAMVQGSQTLHCIEYPITEKESLEFILRYHQSRCTWNAFVRICMALTLESSLQEKALQNMSAGGKYKGLADLPNAQRVDVRQEIARIAGVGARNVSNVKTILQAAHPQLIEALRDGALSINYAIHLCKLPKGKQFEQFASDREEKTISKMISRAILQPKKGEFSQNLSEVLCALQKEEERQPGSVVLRRSDLQVSVVLIGKGLASGQAQRELKLI